MSQRTALYRMYGADGRLLYVGITKHLPNRITAHEGKKPWWSDVGNVAVEHFQTREEALAAERAAIRSEDPLYNIIHSPNPFRSSKILYSGVRMRSHLEVSFAVGVDRYLVRDGFKWQYEPLCFSGANGQWLPDFGLYRDGTEKYIQIIPASTLGSNEAAEAMDFGAVEVAWESRPDAILGIVFLEDVGGVGSSPLWFSCRNGGQWHAGGKWYEAHLCPEHGRASRYLPTGQCAMCLVRDHPELDDGQAAMPQPGGLDADTRANLKATLDAAERNIRR